MGLSEAGHVAMLVPCPVLGAASPGSVIRQRGGQLVCRAAPPCAPQWQSGAGLGWVDSQAVII